jgi:hypothetical protein
VIQKARAHAASSDAALESIPALNALTIYDSALGPCGVLSFLGIDATSILQYKPFQLNPAQSGHSRQTLHNLGECLVEQ